MIDWDAAAVPGVFNDFFLLDKSMTPWRKYDAKEGFIEVFLTKRLFLIKASRPQKWIRNLLFSQILRK